MAKTSRAVLDGILWVLCTRAAWQDLPDRYPSHATCHRRFQECRREGVLEKILQTLASDLKERGGLDLSECFIDGIFVAAKKGPGSGKDQARQSYEGHGAGRSHWSASRRSH